LQYMKDGDNLVVVASNGGNVNHPAWWHNVNANPEVTAQVGKKTMPARAETATGEERARLWPLLVSHYAGYQDY
ncbi:MAG: nitroreductase family deazaflavin-dependent oxidoreductase, partial [Acidobacteria bacterium]|nr:nitroreductase family deazaflavin-dependent oxidoreductase [Acidobacteriota bacterium]NIQ84767.1 nitroreductase family deazaflavin-dependent oxidoreductase [Acidobacteriota bacterium]